MFKFKHVLTFGFVIFFVILAFGHFDAASDSVDSGLTCHNLLVGKPQFKHKHRNKKLKGKVVGLKWVGIEARDQCYTDTCFMHAVSHFLDLHLMWKTSRTQSRYSVEFLLALYGREKALDDIWHGPTGDNNPELTRLPLLTLLTLVARNGYLLESDWTPPRMVAEMSGNGRISDLADFVNHRHEQLKTVRMNYGSSSKNVLGPWKSIKTDLDAELLKIYGRSLTGNPDLLEKIKAAGQNAYRYIRYESSGWVFPAGQEIVSRLRKLVKDSGLSAYYDEEGRSEILKIISKYIGASRPVLASVRWGLDKNRVNTANHAVVITGLIKNDQDQVSHIRILNSWGPQWGDKGGVWFNIDDFFEALIGIEVLARSQDENGGVFIHGAKEK
ncbi:MAG: hypothetical protein IPJ71_14035 [Bdellovibrionales bacterium]|nr:hypothetical protein [Bdellovibrionales bacterium]